MYYYILSTLMLLIVATTIVIVISYYRPEVLAESWNRIIDSSCNQQDIQAINGIPTYCPVELVNSVNINLLHQLLQLHHNEILPEVTSLIEENNGHVISIDNKTPVLKNIVDNVSQLSSGRIVICRPGSTITDTNGPFRFVQRYCYTLEMPLSNVGLNLGGYDVKWEQRTGMIWDSTIAQTIWNHTKYTFIIIMVDFYRPLSLLQHAGSKLVYYLCQKILEGLETAELARVKMIA